MFFDSIVRMNFLLTSNVSEPQPNYEFAFNNRNYSGRVLMIEVVCRVLNIFLSLTSSSKNIITK